MKGSTHEIQCPTNEDLPDVRSVHRPNLLGTETRGIPTTISRIPIDVDEEKTPNGLFMFKNVQINLKLNQNCAVYFRALLHFYLHYFILIHIEVIIKMKEIVLEQKEISEMSISHRRNLAECPRTTTWCPCPHLWSFQTIFVQDTLLGKHMSSNTKTLHLDVCVSFPWNDRMATRGILF